MRHAFVRALCDSAALDERIFLITGDLGYSVLEPFQNQFPDRFLNIGVAEANMITVAAGLSTTGFIPFVYSIAPFASMRPFEQIRNDISFQNRNVKIIGIGGGLAYGKAGPTHHSFEDIALMRTLPSIAIINPCDPTETYAATQAMINHDGPVYMRLERNPSNILPKLQEEFMIGRGRVVHDIGDIALICTGTKLATAYSAAAILKTHGIDVAIYAFPTLQPFDYLLLQDISKRHANIATIEEHSLIGGLGSLVADFFATSSNAKFPRLLKFGLDPQKSPLAASYENLMEYYELTPEQIAATYLAWIRNNTK